MSADPVHDVLGDKPVEFSTAGDLADLMAQLPRDTPVIHAHAIRVDPELADTDEEERTTAAAWTVIQPQLVQVAGRTEQRPEPTVELCAYYAVSADTPRGCRP